jgi:hypothetical protein
VNASGTQSKLNLGRVREAILEELDVLEAEDENLRKREAERAQRAMNDTDQLWGGAMPEAIGNNSGEQFP